MNAADILGKCLKDHVSSDKINADMCLFGFGVHCIHVVHIDKVLLCFVMLAQDVLHKDNRVGLFFFVGPCSHDFNIPVTQCYSQEDEGLLDPMCKAVESWSCKKKKKNAAKTTYATELYPSLSSCLKDCKKLWGSTNFHSPNATDMSLNYGAIAMSNACTETWTNYLLF